MTTLFLLDLALIAYLGTNADFILTFFLGVLAYQVRKSRNPKIYGMLFGIYILGVLSPIFVQILGVIYHFYLLLQAKKKNDNEFLYLENTAFTANLAILSTAELSEIFGKHLYFTAIPKLLLDENLSHSVTSIFVFITVALLVSVASFEFLVYKDERLNSEGSISTITLYALAQTLILLAMHTFAFRGEAMSALSCATFIMQFAGTGFFYIMMLHNYHLKIAR